MNKENKEDASETYRMNMGGMARPSKSEKLKLYFFANNRALRIDKFKIIQIEREILALQDKKKGLENQVAMRELHIKKSKEKVR